LPANLKHENKAYIASAMSIRYGHKHIHSLIRINIVQQQIG